MKKTLSIIVSLLLIFSTILNVKAFETNQIENSSNEVVEDNTNDSSINEDDLQDVDQNENTEIVDDNENSEINTTEGNDEITNQVTTNSPEEVITPKIMYKTHVQDYGWMNYSSNDSISGTIGQSKRIEAIKIRLTGEISNYYDVFYRVQCQDFGWLGWTCNDRIAGTTGGGYRIESIQIKLYPKNITNLGISHLSCITFEDKNGFKVCKDANGTLYEDAQGLLGMKSSYVLRVNKSTNVVTVLAANGTGDYNIAYKRFVCSTGNGTPYGTYYTPVKYRWRYLVGPSYGQYCTRIVNGILFHSLPYDKQNPYTLQTSEFNKLGTTCSHGCVRLMCRDAKWIYDNCGLGTRVDIVSGADPLSKPSAPKIPANQRWDPTDPNI